MIYREPEDIVFSGQEYTPKNISQYHEGVVGKDAAKNNIDACVKGVLVCVESGRPFQILPQELAFYIEHSLPIPRLHPQIRHKHRVSYRAPRHL